MAIKMKIAKQMYVKTKYKIFDYLAPRINESVFEAYARFKSRNLDDTIFELDEEDLESGRQPMPSQKQMVINNYMAERKRRLAYLENAKAYKKGLVNKPDIISVKSVEEGLKLFNDPVTYYKELELKAAAAATAVVVTQRPEAKIKMPVAQYKPTIKGLKQSLLDQLNKRKWSEARNELIYKIEQMDENKLSQLYYENKEYFAIYYYGDSDVYIEDWDDSNYIYGYNDIVKIYEERFGMIL